MFRDRKQDALFQQKYLHAFVHAHIETNALQGAFPTSKENKLEGFLRQLVRVANISLANEGLFQF